MNCEDQNDDLLHEEQDVVEEQLFFELPDEDEIDELRF